MDDKSKLELCVEEIEADSTSVTNHTSIPVTVDEPTTRSMSACDDGNSCADGKASTDTNSDHRTSVTPLESDAVAKGSVDDATANSSKTITGCNHFTIENPTYGSIAMQALRKIITEGTTTLEFMPRTEVVEETDSKSKASEQSSPLAEDEESAEELKAQYITDPLHVRELIDSRDNELVLRQTSSTPFVRSEAPLAPPKHLHVIETVAIKSNPWTGYESDESKVAALDNNKTAFFGIRIISPLLKHTLSSLVKYYPGYAELFRQEEPSNQGRDQYPAPCMERPYKLIMHHRQELEELRSVPLEKIEETLRNEVGERNKHINCMLDFVSRDLGEEYAAEHARHLQDPPVATFRHFWILLKPGSSVYRKVDGVWSCWIIKSHEGGLVDGRLLPYKVTLWNICFDGEKFGRYKEEHTIQPWEYEMSVREMRLYPTTMHDTTKNLSETVVKEKLIERGRMYVKLANQSHCDYHGPCLTHPKRTYNSAVMIDTAMQPWLSSNHVAWTPKLEEDSERVPATCSCSVCVETTESEETGPFAFTSCDTSTAKLTFTDEQYLICSYWVYGYILSARTWEILSLDHLKDHEDNSDYIDKLVVDPDSMHMIKAICRVYAREHSNTGNSTWSADMIRGKGEGQIFLLHGKPGVGKTLTAECVAEYTHRPLLPLTPGDIGTDPVTVDTTLARYFRLGESWGAIILLDEADVYLEARNLHDLQRNSLVSIFLRAMEYYQGILFLTTNRVGSFDEAFASRIHVHLYYNDLSDDDRGKIYDNLIEKLETEREDVSIESRAIEYLKESEQIRKIGWNGRQIRNAFQTAVSLAEYDASEEAERPQLCKHCKNQGHSTENCGEKHPSKKGKKVFVKRKHMEQVYNMSSRFTKYIKSAKGGEDSKLAKIDKLRADDFKE